MVVRIGVSRQMKVDKLFDMLFDLGNPWFLVREGYLYCDLDSKYVPVLNHWKEYDAILNWWIFHPVEADDFFMQGGENGRTQG